MFEQMISTVPGVRSLAVASGDQIFRQGEPATAIFQVQRGSVAMERHLADGTLLTIATSGPGDTFAEASLFADHYHCDAIVRTKGEVLSIPSAQLRRMLEADSRFAIALADFLARRVRELRTRLEIQRIRRAPDRVMAWLLWRARGQTAISIADAWTRIASELSLTPEALYRSLKDLERAGKIARSGRKIHFPGK